MRRLVAATLAAALLLAPATAAAATCPKTALGDIEDEVMCLQCGVPLNVAEDAPAAKRERVFIQSQIDQCKSKDQIKDELVAQFGDRILAEPQGSEAWIVPAVGFAAGVLLAGFAAYRWRRRRTATTTGTAPSPPAAALTAQDAARLEADIKRYDP